MMEVLTNLWIGDQDDFEYKVKGKEGWFVIHACKEPYHCCALGYRGRGAPKEHPEYLIAERPGRLILNLVDAEDPNYIPKEIIDKAIATINNKLKEGKKVLVHCNKGLSRSAGIGFLYLASHSDKFKGLNLQEALIKYCEIYPIFSPAGGIKGFIQRNWETFQAN